MYIGMTNAAKGNLDIHVIGTRIRTTEFCFVQESKEVMSQAIQKEEYALFNDIETEKTRVSLGSRWKHSHDRFVATNEKDTAMLNEQRNILILSNVPCFLSSLLVSNAARARVPLPSLMVAMVSFLLCVGFVKLMDGEKQSAW
jgi:hypothetical protein